MKTGIKVSDAMTKKLITVPKETTIDKCAEIMKKNDVGGLIIRENNKVLGLITEKDIVQRVIAQNLSQETPVKDVMSTRITTIDPEKDIYEALILMNQEEIRRLPVVLNNKLVGLLTDTDILKLQPSLFEIVSEKIILREQEDKIIQGKCKSCGSIGPVKKIKGKLLCEVCRD